MSSVLINSTDSIGKMMRTRVVKIRPDDTVGHAAEFMVELRIGSVVVVENDRPIGIITERDCVRLMAKGQPPETRARDAMTTPVITCESDRKVTDALTLMATNRVNHLPITENGKLVGIVASRDFLTATLVKPLFR